MTLTQAGQYAMTLSGRNVEELAIAWCRGMVGADVWDALPATQREATAAKAVPLIAAKIG